MAFFKFRWPGQKAQDEGTKPARRSRGNAHAESIDALRRRARHRLIGAAVLVLLGIIGFPMLFDTQPRPVAVDIPIEIPDRGKVAPLVVPETPKVQQAAADSKPSSASSSSSSSSSGAVSGGNAAGLDAGEEIVPPRAESKPAAVPAPAPVPVPASAVVARAEAPAHASRTESKAEAKTETKSDSRPEARHEPRTESKPAAAASSPEPARQPSRNDDAARARALLEGRPVATAGAHAAPAAAASKADEDGRFIVQVGAFADADKAREARTKLERAGLKTYTQVVDTKEGKRTRVRAGPFASRAEADKAAGRIKALGLSASVLTL